MNMKNLLCFALLLGMTTCLTTTLWAQEAATGEAAKKNALNFKVNSIDGK